MTKPAIQIEAIVKCLPELKEFCGRKVDATDLFNAACKTVAQNSGIEASVIKKFVNASFDVEKREEHKQKAQQLSLLFDKIPEG